METEVGGLVKGRVNNGDHVSFSHPRARNYTIRALCSMARLPLSECMSLHINEPHLHTDRGLRTSALFDTPGGITTLARGP